MKNRAKTLTTFKKTTGAKVWYIADAQGVVLGQLATKVADVLRGKEKATFSPSLDNGANVIVINMTKIVLTGNKMEDKLYRTHSGYIGHLKTRSAKQVMEKKPSRILTEAVYGMLPKNRMRKFLMKKLYIYSGSDHKHAGQNPTPLSI